MQMQMHMAGVRALANYNLPDPLGFYVVYAPIRDLSAAFFYYHPVAVLGWKAEHDLTLSPVVILEPVILHIHATCYQ